jgi:membrane associated rhomboid family serine protease
MGIYDRDYYRRSLPKAGFGHFSAWSVTTWLIVINIAVFFADGILHRADAPALFDPDTFDNRISITQWELALMGPLERWGYLSIDKALRHGQVWRFITFQFLHASPWHLIMNMLGLYFFGPIVEAQFGPRRYLGFYLSCGLAGAVTFVFLALAHVLHTDAITPLVGASAGIFGLLVAAAMIAPDVQLFYYFIPITIRMVAIFGMLMAAYSVFALNQFNAGGEAAHLGGGVLGFLLMKNQHWLNPFAPQRRELATVGAPRRRRRTRAFQKDWSKDFNR